ncbi:MAG: type II toxin-antitoxin system VapB family antitoxin [Neomegalonema sp.]|nr:type II toxin-antitoxin system VapB family antitoxin [Neomegalonema sp.]
MHLSIRHPEAVKIARTLAHKTGENINLAIMTALRERLDLIETREREQMLSNLQETVEAFAQLPRLDASMTEADIVEGVAEEATPQTPLLSSWQSPSTAQDASGVDIAAAGDQGQSEDGQSDDGDEDNDLIVIDGEQEQENEASAAQTRADAAAAGDLAAARDAWASDDDRRYDDPRGW